LARFDALFRIIRVAEPLDSDPQPARESSREHLAGSGGVGGGGRGGAD